MATSALVMRAKSRPVQGGFYFYADQKPALVTLNPVDD